MRSDQEIGLTERARIFLGKLKNSDEFIKEEFIILDSYAFSDQKVMGKKIWINPDSKVNKEEYFEETIQFIKWSSGPMYFTCLKHIIIKEMNSQILELGNCYEWTKDPMITREFDYKLGAYNL